jgi:hypothetical protein
MLSLLHVSVTSNHHQAEILVHGHDMFSATIWDPILFTFCFSGSAAQRGQWPPHITRFLDYTQRRATVGRTPLDE